MYSTKVVTWQVTSFALKRGNLSSDRDRKHGSRKGQQLSISVSSFSVRSDFELPFLWTKRRYLPQWTHEWPRKRLRSRGHSLHAPAHCMLYWLVLCIQNQQSKELSQGTNEWMNSATLSIVANATQISWPGNSSHRLRTCNGCFRWLRRSWRGWRWWLMFVHQGAQEFIQRTKKTEKKDPRALNEM